MSSPKIINIKCTSINKSLLTPCRRVGLSRTKKRPSSLERSINTSLSDSQNEISLLETIPFTPKKLAKRTKIVASVQENDSFVQTPPCNERKLINRVKSEDSSNRNLASESKGDHNVKPLEMYPGVDKTNSEDIVKQETAFRRFKTEEFLCSESEVIENTNKIGERLDNDRCFIEKLSPATKQNESLNQNKLNLLMDKPKSKNIRRSLSTKKSANQLSAEDIKSVISCSSNLDMRVKLERLSEDEISEKLPIIRIDYVENETLQSDEIKNEVLKFPISIEDHDDEIVFTSTPEKNANEKAELIKWIKTIEIDVKQKREKLAKLKQAAVYHTKHSPDKLQPLIDKWKTGCTLGLKDLLVNLQTHGPMDMNVLVNNLRLPCDIVSKLQLNYSE